MSAVREVHRGRARGRRWHLGALLALLAYGAAAFALYQLLSPVLGGEAQPSDDATAATGAGANLPSVGPDALAWQTISSRARQSVYAISGPGGASGSGFVGWVRNGRISFLVTAQAAVAPAVAEGGGTVQVRRGNQSWPARVVRMDGQSGLALVRVNAQLPRPLWPQPRNRAPLRRGEPVSAVPAGRMGPFRQGTVAVQGNAALLEAAAGEANLGAPVVIDDGTVAGVVVSGEGRLAPLAAACRLRGC